MLHFKFLGIALTFLDVSVHPVLIDSCVHNAANGRRLEKQISINEIQVDLCVKSHGKLN